MITFNSSSALLTASVDKFQLYTWFGYNPVDHKVGLRSSKLRFLSFFFFFLNYNFKLLSSFLRLTSMKTSQSISKSQIKINRYLTKALNVKSLYARWIKVFKQVHISPFWRSIKSLLINCLYLLFGSSKSIRLEVRSNSIDLGLNKTLESCGIFFIFLYNLKVLQPFLLFWLSIPKKVNHFVSQDNLDGKWEMNY